MALEQHPVPQQISSYQFRLVGDMTLKQFFQLAAGAGVGLLIYGSPLPAFIKWPLVIFFVIMGAAFAFLPVQDRPLSVWLLAFFRSIYSPTIFTWDRSYKTEFFAAEDSEAPSFSESGESSQAQDIKSTFLGSLEDAEEKYLSKITGLFHKDSDQQKPEEAFQQPEIINKVSPIVPPIPQLETPAAATNTGTGFTTPITANNNPQQESLAGDTYSYYRPTPPVPPQFTTSVNNFNQEMPEDTTVPFETKEDKPIFQSPQAMEEIISAHEPGNEIYNSGEEGVGPQNSALIQQMEPPTQANIIVGKILDQNSNPLANAIMEIKDEFGRPVRALKSDKDGKFRIVTPLHDGRYTIFTEKDDYQFEPIELELQNTLVEPMIIEGSTSQTKTQQ